jgi:hypothetical protein
VAFLQVNIGNRATAQLLNRMPTVAEITSAGGSKGGTRFEELKSALDFYHRLLNQKLGWDADQISQQADRMMDLLGRIQYLAQQYTKDHTHVFGIRDKRTKRLADVPREAELERALVRQRARYWKGKIDNEPNPPTWRDILPKDMSGGVMDLDKQAPTRMGKSKGGINEVTHYKLAGCYEGFFKPDKKKIEKYEYWDEENNVVPKGTKGAQQVMTLEYNVTAPYGIDPDKPNFTRKAVATSRIDRLLNLGVGAHTDMATKTIGGKKVFGSFQKRAAGDQLGSQEMTLDEDLSGKIAMDDPVMQRSFSKLTLLDALTGQLDRHSGNVHVENGPYGVRSVTAIDHDLSFPTKSFDMTAKVREFTGLTKNVDREAAEMVLAVEEGELRLVLKDLLTKEEIDACVARLAALKVAVRNMSLRNANQWTRTTAQEEVKGTGTFDAQSYLGSMRVKLGGKPLPKT